MQSMGSRPQEINHLQHNARTRRPRKSSYGSNGSPLAHSNRPQVQFTSGCNNTNNINNHFLHQVPSTFTYKSKNWVHPQYYDSKKPQYLVEADSTCDYHKSSKYDRKKTMKSSYEKNSWISNVSTASESDSSSSHTSSELNGFKIVQKGKIVHDETGEEPDSPLRVNFEIGNGRYASSVLVVGPNVKEISIPTFA